MVGGGQAERAGDDTVRAARSPGGRFLARGGFVFVGLLHLIVAYLALRVALGGRAALGGAQHADQSGAVGAIASAPGGLLVLWAGAVCCAALALWWVSEAILDARRPSSGTWDVLMSAGKATLFLAVGGLFLSYALGAGPDSREKAQEITATILAAPGGQLVLFAIGTVLVGAGVYYVWRGVTREFLGQEVHAHGRARRPVAAVGVFGYAAKGVALAIVGILVAVATARHDPSESTGLDGALRGLAAQPYGAWLLGAVALGLACFGIYSMARAKYGTI
ncbi:DUF1206 domain-containing protein [Sinomonas mesophila]|uniref:DUF1206 domain-containing protein n=1 Tax=Sinomonas mesophila TaxID=1531955 RepID=UPI000985E909|nr:DUF1206 domain-containing protein [Sinomonas mesophila]